MPKDEMGDALHLAYASFYKIDFLLTWNCNHLANANKKQHIRILNNRLNLFVPEIITPLELFTELQVDAMYTNELLEEKHKTQKELSASVQDIQESYFDMIEQYVKELYKSKNWNLVYSKRQGGFLSKGKRRKSQTNFFMGPILLVCFLYIRKVCSLYQFRIELFQRSMNLLVYGNILKQKSVSKACLF